MRASRVLVLADRKKILGTGARSRRLTFYILVFALLWGPLGPRSHHRQFYALPGAELTSPADAPPFLYLTMRAGHRSPLRDLIPRGGAANRACSVRNDTAPERIPRPPIPVTMRRDTDSDPCPSHPQTATIAAMAKPLRCLLRLHRWEYRENPETHEHYQVCARCNAYRDRGSSAFDGRGSWGLGGGG